MPMLLAKRCEMGVAFVPLCAENIPDEAQCVEALAPLWGHRLGTLSLFADPDAERVRAVQRLGFVWDQRMPMLLVKRCEMGVAFVPLSAVSSPV